MTIATSNRLATSNKLAIRQHQQGFTLLEVMVALAILAVVAISASQASRSYVQSVDNMKTRTFGYYVAQNTLAELRVQKTWLAASDTRQITSQGRQWQVVISPQTIQTSQGFVQPIHIRVAPIVDGSPKKDVVDIDAMLVKDMGTTP